MAHVRTLSRFVRESNAIERIYATKGQPLFDRHLSAARLVEIMAQKGKLVTPLEIHQTLLPELSGYRTRNVCVGNRDMPPHQEVPQLMELWIKTYCRWHALMPKPADAFWHKWANGCARNLHFWLLCIHPFEDGNGRTARLVMNSFRRASGFPWRVIKAEKKYEYYAEIREYEHRAFHSWYPPEKWKY